MRNYYQIRLGEGSIHEQVCVKGNFIGTDFLPEHNLTTKLPSDWRPFNREFIPIYLSRHPDKSKIAAGLACGALWTISKGIRIGDVVLCPNGQGFYHVGEITGHYTYQANDILPHRRSVQWLTQMIDRNNMSEGLRNSTRSIGTSANITKHGEEIERLIQGVTEPTIVATDETIEDPAAFAMEMHLEDFLVKNWAHSGLGKEYDIFEEDGKPAGQQYETAIGRIDILAVSKNKKVLLVIELKRGRASDVVVGQIMRYMGYVKEVLAEENQIVKGAIIALEDDPKIRWALAAAQSIDFYRYQISFKLVKA